MTESHFTSAFLPLPLCVVVSGVASVISMTLSHGSIVQSAWLSSVHRTMLPCECHADHRRDPRHNNMQGRGKKAEVKCDSVLKYHSFMVDKNIKTATNTYRTTKKIT